LVQTKIVTINSLLKLLPNVADPTPFLYNTTMYSASALVAAAVIVNLMIKPVDAKNHEKVELLEVDKKDNSFSQVGIASNKNEIEITSANSKEKKDLNDH